VFFQPLCLVVFEGSRNLLSICRRVLYRLRREGVDERFHIDRFLNFGGVGESLISFALYTEVFPSPAPQIP